MANPKKIIVTSKKNLLAKYGSDFTKVEKLLNALVTADGKRSIDTQIVYIDDAVSAKKAGITAAASITRQTCKKAVDDVYNKQLPAYLVIFGSRDIIPFQELANMVPYDANGDDNRTIPSDLPYACEAPYSTRIDKFIGPTRVVGRIPDITGKADLGYVKTVINAIIDHKPLKEEKFQDYFAVTAYVWKKSTQQSLSNIFGNSTKLKDCPPSTISYTASTLKPLTHFYNCHGGPIDSRYYGQKGSKYPTAMESTDLKNKISAGTIVAAECCYGAELYDPADEGNRQLPISNTYFQNKAIAFVGSSTIAYGPSEGQGQADYITQYFIKNVIAGASSGRAFLEARQKFLGLSPTPDPWELKTIAQFYLLGDPSLQPVIKPLTRSGEDTVDNRRLNLTSKGLNLADTVAICEQVDTPSAKARSKEVAGIFKAAGFTGKEEEYLFEVQHKSDNSRSFIKSISGMGDVSFRAFVKKSRKVKKNLNIFDVLVLKESGDKLLGWKVYNRK